jgi:PIN domain nuclease of toxin-antitoxin system
MKFLLDTHIMLWTVFEPHRLPPAIVDEIADASNILLFSVVSIWEVAIKQGRNHPDFALEADRLRSALLEEGYIELPVFGEHALCIRSLPPIHRDPFDRLLIAQASVEGATIMTADAIVAEYPVPVRRVKPR